MSADMSSDKISSWPVLRYYATYSQFSPTESIDHRPCAACLMGYAFQFFIQIISEDYVHKYLEFVWPFVGQTPRKKSFMRL